VIAGVYLCQHPRDPPPLVRMHRQEVDDVGIGRVGIRGRLPAEAASPSHQRYVDDSGTARRQGGAGPDLATY
jgi:hypothetical protein